MVKGLTYLICVALAASWTSVLADKCDTYVHPTYGVGKCVNTARCPNSLYVSSLCENYPNDVKCCFNTPTEDCSTYSHPQYGKGKCVKVSACSSSSQLSLRGYCDGMASDYTCCFDKTTTPAPTAPLRSCGISETKGKGVCVKSNICPNGNIASAAASSPCDLGADEVCCYSLQGNLDYYEFRGVWVSTVANIDFPTKRTLTTEQQKAELLKIVETVQAIGLNAIVFQVRPAGDALYKSNYEPWSVYLTGTQGKAPSPEWDPLAFIIEEGHKRNIDIHAWLNPYRGRSKGESYTLASNHMAKRFPNYAYNFDGYVLMDPSSEEVRQHTLNVVEDIVSRYDVDGVHIDDYFYPYPVDGVVFPDDGPYNTYKAQGGTLGKSDWRRENVNRLVKALYEKVKSIKPLVQFGVAPFGIWRPGNPPGITGFDAYEGLYGDSKKWLENGWLDYFTPQLYWATFSTGQNFTKLLDWWCDKAQNKMGKLIYAGTAVYKMKDNGWAASEIINQIQTTRNAHVSGAYGATHFTMNYLLSDYKGIATEMKKVYSKPALTPLIAAKN